MRTVWVSKQWGHVLDGASVCALQSTLTTISPFRNPAWFVWYKPDGLKLLQWLERTLFSTLSKVIIFRYLFNSYDLEPKRMLAFALAM